MNFNNNLPNFLPFPQTALPNDSQFESLLKLFAIPPQIPPTNPPPEQILDDRQKNPSNFKAMMAQMLLNNYRNSMMIPPQMNGLMYPPPSASLLTMLNAPNGPMQVPNDPIGLRRNSMMNDMFFQTFLSKFNMMNMMNPYQMYPMNNPLMNSMMMETFFRNYLQQNNELANNSNCAVVNLDNVITGEICICSGKKNHDEVVMTCGNETCKKKFHLSCLKYKQPELECPLCFLKKMDPLHQVCKVLTTPFLINGTSNVVFKKKFQLDLESLKQFMENEDVYLEIRSLRLDEGYKYETSWLDYGTVSLNDITVLELNPLLLNSCLKKRKDERITIKEYIKGELNEIKITTKDFPNEEEAKTYRNDKKAEFLVGIYLIRKVSTNELMNDIMDKCLKSELECKKFLQSYFSKDLNNRSEDIYLDQMKINLLDPIDFQPIKTPCRGRFCRHYNCFSLETFVTITKDSNPRKWRCPICKKPCYEFLIDGYLLKILNEARIEKKNIKEMILFDDGKYNMVEDLNMNDDCSEKEEEEEEKKEKEKEQEQVKEKPKEKEEELEKISLIIDENQTSLVKEKEKEKNQFGELSEHTKNTVNEYQKIEKNCEEEHVFYNRKRKLREMDKTEKKAEGKGGYHLRSKKVCVKK